MPTRHRFAALSLLTCIALAAPRPASAACEGDCDGSGTVTIPELIVAVNIALGRTEASQCPGACPNPPLCIEFLLTSVGNLLNGCPIEIPPLASSDPVDGADGVPGTAWIRLNFSGPVDEADLADFALSCDDTAMPVTTSALSPDVVIINPEGTLVGACEVAWPNGSVAFTAVRAGTLPTVFYDRNDPRRTSPFPDDFLTVPADTATGLRVNMPVPPGNQDLERVFGGLLPEANKLDGFSPIAHFVIELSAAPDTTTLPLTAAASLDPLATVGLFDIDPDSPNYGERIPFLLKPRTDTSVAQVVNHSLLIFPSVPLRQEGRYGLIVFRRVLVDPSRPFDKSAYFGTAFEGPSTGLDEGQLRVRALAEEVLQQVVETRVPTIDKGDIALAVRISVRSTDAIADTVLAMKEQVLAAPPAAYTITNVEAQSESSPLAAIVRATWQAPEWRSCRFPPSSIECDPNLTPRLHLMRDSEGRPLQTDTKAIPFTLALPKAALTGAVPIAMYQHGNPGSSENEVPSAARRSLAADGFAVIGFTDVLNRELSAGITDPDQAILAQVAPVLGDILERARIPDFWFETRGEMLAFLRFFDGFGDLDVLPVGAPDGVPELDVDAPRVYLGISEGGNNGQGFLPYAPEIRAAAVVVGGARLGEVLIHQGADLFLNVLGGIFRGLTPSDIWVGVSLFQTLFDEQDNHNHVRFLYRDPFEVAGTLRKPSVLAIEGLDDTLVPNSATDSMAWWMGPIPHVAPVQRPVPFLEVVTGPISGNIDAETTAGFYQYVPVGVPGIPETPGCSGQPEGHYCAQTAPVALEQRTVFFQSALEGVPVIVDPLSQAGAVGAASAGDPIVW